MADSYGTTPVLDDLRDKIETQLNSLMAAITACTAKYEYVHNNHIIAAMLLNAASCDFGSIDQIPAGVSGGLFTKYEIEMNIRIHTGYVGSAIKSPVDTQEIGRLLDSVNTWFMTHYDLSDGYKILEVSAINIYEEFPESSTFGGSLSLRVFFEEDHVQA